MRERVLGTMMSKPTENIVEFPLLKEVNADEATQIAMRIGAKQGIILFECPCGCGKVKSIEIGEPSVRDLLFFAENLRNYAMEEYIDEVESGGYDEIS